MSMNLFALVLIVLNSLLYNVAEAREVKDLTLEVATGSKQEAFDRAVEEATHKLTEEILGPERTVKVWASIRPKLLKNSTRYVIFIKGGTPTEGADPKIAVQMRLSPDSLESLLREIGAVSTSTVRLLPLILVSESRGSRYAWWADLSDEKTPSFSQELFKKLYQQLASQFKGKNIYVLDPTAASFRMGIPTAYRSEGLRREDQALLAQYLNADVVLSGTAQVVREQAGAAKINYDLQLWQGKSGREISVVQRSEPAISEAPKVLMQSMEAANTKVLQELSGKLSELMAAGSLNLNVVRVTVEGALPYKQMNEFKKQLGTVREVRALRERLFEPSKVTFEAESSVSASDLAKAIQKTRFSLFQVAVDETQDNGLVLSVRPSAQ